MVVVIFIRGTTAVLTPTLARPGLGVRAAGAGDGDGDGDRAGSHT